MLIFWKQNTKDKNMLNYEIIKASSERWNGCRLYWSIHFIISDRRKIFFSSICILLTSNFNSSLYIQTQSLLFRHFLNNENNSVLHMQMLEYQWKSPIQTQIVADNITKNSSIQFSHSIVSYFVTPMDWNTSGFPVHQ